MPGPAMIPPMTNLGRTPDEDDYVLGTNDEEIQRLGLQHRVWRPAMLDCWQRAGVTSGSRVLDVGAGPGYATLDLAEIVGPRGAVVAIERSARFAEAARRRCQLQGLAPVKVHELDLMTDELPPESFDAIWCRWVASFVPRPSLLIRKLAGLARPGTVAIFHEYIDYSTWRLAPRCERLEEFVQEVMGSWRAAAGEPDVALALPTLLRTEGFAVRSAVPKVFCIGPASPIWRWPASFVATNLDRLVALQRVDRAWAESVREAFAQAEARPDSLMITPMVLEIVAERGPAA